MKDKIQRTMIEMDRQRIELLLLCIITNTSAVFEKGQSTQYTTYHMKQFSNYQTYVNVFFLLSLSLFRFICDTLFIQMFGLKSKKRNSRFSLQTKKKKCERNVLVDVYGPPPYMCICALYWMSEHCTLYVHILRSRFDYNADDDARYQKQRL